MSLNFKKSTLAGLAVILLTNFGVNIYRAVPHEILANRLKDQIVDINKNLDSLHYFPYLLNAVNPQEYRDSVQSLTNQKDSLQLIVEENSRESDRNFARAVLFGYTPLRF